MRSGLCAVVSLATLSTLALSQGKPPVLLAATPPIGWNSWSRFAAWQHTYSSRTLLQA